ncbi:MAG: pyrroline-5-carboxylate reductase [Helicobacteraceae bacterium]|jgi:pyrroline-5-carboxylate reductase|nr:pyrroline-5-carboxylate reductase [Helicobacteraceae bacterium]
MEILLIGAGNMGGALLAGWGSEHDVLVIESNAARREALALKGAKFADNMNAAKNRVVVLAVKPQSLDSVRINVKAEAIVSIMAGVPLQTLRERFDANHFARVMPNLAAMNMASATAVTGDRAFKERALELFNVVGKSVWLENEKDLAIATALSGSGPGYLAVIAEAMANAAVRLGMQNKDAHNLTKALFAGMPYLLEAEHPALLKERVCSPGGTTAAGIAALEKNGVRHAINEAIKAAFEQSEKMMKKL